MVPLSTVPCRRLAAGAALLLAAWAGACRSPRPRTFEEYGRGPTKTYVEGLFGFAAYDEELVAGTDSEDLPAIGFAAQHPLRSGDVELGLEAGTLIGFEFDERTVIAPGGSIVFVADDALIVGDFFFGGFAALHAGHHVRLYVGAGPQLSLAYFDRSADDGDVVSWGSGLGVYARAGIQFRLNDELWVGLGMRRLESELDFDELPDTDLSGTQGFVTFAAHF